MTPRTWIQIENIKTNVKILLFNDYQIKWLVLRAKDNNN